MWRAIVRFILWDFPRGSWQYDVMVALILAFIFLTPRSWFRDQPRPPSIAMVEVKEGGDMLWLAPELLQGLPPRDQLNKATRLIEQKLGRKVELVRLDTILDAENEPTGYIAWVKK